MRLTPTNETKYVFVIHTINYAGNFEREMCAYCTGEIGDCEVGKKEANNFLREFGGKSIFEDIILQVPDGHGCCRPVSIWDYAPNSKSVAIFFEEQPTPHQVKLMSRRAKEFAKQKHPHDETSNAFITITGFELVEEKIATAHRVLEQIKNVETP